MRTVSIIALLVLMTAAAAVHMSEGSEAKTVDPTAELDGGTVHMDVGDKLRKDFHGNGFTYTLVLRSVAGAPWLKAYNVGVSDRGYIFGTATAAGTWDVTLVTEIWRGGNQGSSESVTQNFTVAVGQSSGDIIRKVTFNTNGGSGSVVTWNILSGNTIDLPTNLFSRAGHMLSGWNVSATAAEGSFGKRTVAADVTLYAIWTHLPPHDPEHAHFKDSDAPSFCLRGNTYDHSFPMTDWSGLVELTNGEPSNLVFSGPSWMTFTCGSDRILRFGGTPVDAGNYLLKVTTKRMSDYYIWWTINVPSATDSISVLSFSPGQGTGSYASVSAPEGTAVVLPSHDSGFVRPGYTLAAFSTPISGTDVLYPLSSIYTFTGSDAVMTAHYVTDEGIIIFDANGGTCEQGVHAFIVQSDGIVTFPVSGYSKSGSVFIGWRPSADPGGPVYGPGYLYPVSEATPTSVMTAAWARSTDTLEKVIFDANGGSAAGSGSVSVPVGTSIYLPSAGYSKDGSSLTGWNTSPTGDGTHFDKGSPLAVSGTMRIYAEWSSGGGGTDPLHTVEFVLNGGTGSVPTQNVPHGSAAGRPADPSMDCCAFIGWQRVGDIAMWDFSSPVMADMVLRAIWQKMFVLDVSGTAVSITLAQGYYGGSATVDWGDGSAVEVFSTSASHDYAAGSSGTLRVTFYNGHSAPCHYDVGSAVGSSAIKFVDKDGQVLKTVSVNNGTILSEGGLLALLGETGRKVEGFYNGPGADFLWTIVSVDSDITVWVRFAEEPSAVTDQTIVVVIAVLFTCVCIAAYFRSPRAMLAGIIFLSAFSIFYIMRVI